MNCRGRGTDDRTSRSLGSANSAPTLTIVIDQRFHALSLFGAALVASA